MPTRARTSSPLSHTPPAIWASTMWRVLGACNRARRDARSTDRPPRQEVRAGAQSRCGAGRRTRSGGRHAWPRQAGYALRAQRIDAHWLRDVLDALISQVLERVRKPVADVLADGARDADAARLG